MCLFVCLGWVGLFFFCDELDVVGCLKKEGGREREKE